MGGLNTYGYVGGNPLSHLDRTGHNAATAIEGAEIGAAFGGPWGAAAGAVIGFGIGALAANSFWNWYQSQEHDSTRDATGEDVESCDSVSCKDDGCPPCKTVSGRIVPVGTLAYRPLDVIPDDEKQHGVFGSHHNIFTAQQNPNNCQCFWKKEKYVLKPEELPSGAIPIEPFAN